MFEILRSHSDDGSPHLIETVDTLKEADKKIAKLVAEENAILSTPHATTKNGHEVRTTFKMWNDVTWSITYWVSKI